MQVQRAYSCTHPCRSRALEDPEVTDFWAPNPASENTLNHSLSWQHTPSCITSEHRDETEDPEVTDFWSRVDATAEVNRIQTATQSPRLRALSDTLHSRPNRFRAASLSQEQYFEVVAWIARLENRPAQGIYRVWIEPSDDPVDVQPYVRPTTDTYYSVGMRSVRRGIYRDMYCIALIPTIIHVCLHGCETTLLFNCAPPRVEDYLR
jgi:hypothetical protein